MVKISEVMVKDVLTAGEKEYILSMLEKLHRHRLGAIVIIDKEMIPVGIISERDIMRRFSPTARRLSGNRGTGCYDRPGSNAGRGRGY